MKTQIYKWNGHTYEKQGPREDGIPILNAVSGKIIIDCIVPVGDEWLNIYYHGCRKMSAITHHPAGPRATELISWEDCDLPAHTRAWMLARKEFTKRESREPTVSADFSAVAKRAETIRRKGVSNYAIAE